MKLKIKKLNFLIGQSRNFPEHSDIFIGLYAHEISVSFIDLTLTMTEIETIKVKKKETKIFQ